MYYGEIKNCDIADGPGVRVSLFVSGCRNHCKGCFQPQTWDFNYGKPFTKETEFMLIDMLKPDYIKGITILGGDPFEPENLPVVTEFLRFVKLQYPKKSVWIYTGYRFEDFLQSEVMQYADCVVDGRFIESQKNLSLRFRGSENQRIIDVQKSLESGETVLWSEPDREGLM